VRLSGCETMRFVTRKISSEEAREILGARGKFPFRRKSEMKKVELVYLPYYAHRVTVWQGNGEHEVSACVDAISSGFFFFDAEQAVFQDDAEGTLFDFQISPEEARRVCLENLRWHLVYQGLRLKVRASAGNIGEVRSVYYPYWVAYFKGRKGYDFRALDAVTGKIEGAQVRRTLLSAFLQNGALRRAISYRFPRPGAWTRPRGCPRRWRFGAIDMM